MRHMKLRLIAASLILPSLSMPSLVAAQAAPEVINSYFEVSKYEVTFDDWDKCLSDGGCNGYRPDDKEWGKGKRPVINISYDDAQSFISWLCSKTGNTYRLLSEAEWEYVARAGQDTPFGYGFKMSAKLANFDGKAPYGTSEQGGYERKTVPVGRYDDYGLRLARTLN